MAVASDDVSALFPGPEAWDSAPYDSSNNYHYTSLPTSDSTNSQGSRPLFSNTSIQETSMPSFFNLSTAQSPMETVQVTCNDTNWPNSGAGRPAAMHVSPYTGSAPPTRFLASNASRSPCSAPNTISPLQVCFDAQSVSNTSVSADGLMRSPTASSFDHWSEVLSENSPEKKRRRRSDITHSNVESSSATKRGTGRRRASENVEPGSARAIYLEKNRKAASKCRNKQRVQQEELVVAAREYERKNRVLKAELDILKADMRQLMEVVEQHSHCPDKRLQIYVQHEADRLSARDKEDPVAQILLSKERFSPGHG